MYVYNLPPDTNEMMLLQLFCQYGAILNARPMMDYTTGQCKVHLLITTRLTTVTFLSPLARLTTVVPNTAPPLAAYPPPIPPLIFKSRKEFFLGYIHSLYRCFPILCSLWHCHLITSCHLMMTFISGLRLCEYEEL